MDFSPIKLDKKVEEASSYATHLGVLSPFIFYPFGTKSVAKKKFYACCLSLLVLRANCFFATPKTFSSQKTVETTFEICSVFWWARWPSSIPLGRYLAGNKGGWQLLNRFFVPLCSSAYPLLFFCRVQFWWFFRFSRLPNLNRENNNREITY